MAEDLQPPGMMSSRVWEGHTSLAVYVCWGTGHWRVGVEDSAFGIVSVSWVSQDGLCSGSRIPPPLYCPAQGIWYPSPILWPVTGVQPQVGVGVGVEVPCGILGSRLQAGTRALQISSNLLRLRPLSLLDTCLCLSFTHPALRCT